MTDQPEPKHATLKEMAEDASGFGVAELRLTRDLIVRPAAAMAAYDEHGSTAGGKYPRPLRYYLALNGLILLINAMAGGVERTVMAGDARLLDLLVRRTDKSREEFIADMDQWVGILSVPAYTLVMVLPIFLLISRWSPLNWRADLGQTFSYLNAWTLYQTPLMVLVLIDPSGFAGLSVALMLALGVVVYARVGRGRWWRTAAGAWGKGALLTLVILVAMIPASVAVFGGAALGAIYLP